jgi:hypothetical protein
VFNVSLDVSLGEIHCMSVISAAGLSNSRKQAVSKTSTRRPQFEK